MSISPAFDCFTIIQVPLSSLSNKHSMLHGIGDIETGAHYIRSAPLLKYDWHDDWYKMGYVWSSVVRQSGYDPVLRMCRDNTLVPDYSPILAKSYANAEMKDVAIENGIPRWLKIFKYLHGDITSQGGDIFQPKNLSPGCNARNTNECTIKDIIKLIHMGSLSVDEKYECAFEGTKPLYAHSPTYKFNKELSISDIVDNDKQITLIRNDLDCRIAIVTILGRIHLIRRDPRKHEWYLINKVGTASTTNHVLSSALEEILEQKFNKLHEVLIYGGKGVVPRFSTRNSGVMDLSGNLGCPDPLQSVRVKKWGKAGVKG